jgi:Spy/CpxP family protein refolding chaperone
MKKRNLIIAGVLTTGLAIAGVGAASAYQRGGFGPVGSGPGCDGHAGMMFGGPGMGGIGIGGPELGGPGPWRGLVRALDLNDEQRDKIFDLMYAQVPAARDKLKELRMGHDALHEATIAKTYDAEKVRELASAQSKLIADLIVMKTEAFNKAYALLTPEQQKKVAEFKGDGRRGPHRRWSR